MLRALPRQSTSGTLDSRLGVQPLAPGLQPAVAVAGCSEGGTLGLSLCQHYNTATLGGWKI